MRTLPFRFAFLMGIASVFSGCISLPPFGPSNDRGRVGLELVEPSKGFFTQDQILLLPLSGLVTMGDLRTGLSGDAGMLVELKDRLDAARKNKLLRAVVLRIDSPGGTVTAADLVYRELVRFKKETGLPVIALLTDTAASGGLYIAMAADEIYALPTTITGSIGVIVMYPNLEGLMQKLGVGVDVIKAGSLKDAGSPWRPMTGEEKEVFQTIVDQYHERFRGVILESRKEKGLTREGLLKISDGRILTPQQAVEAHLIDGIRYHEDVIALAKQRAKLNDADIVSYEYPYSYRGHFYARSDAPAPRVGGGSPGSFSLLSIDGEAMVRELFGARFLYLWMP